MSRFIKRMLLFCFVLAFLTGGAAVAGLEYLNMPNNPRAAGMGGCAVNLVDEQSALYNPAALGLFHLDKRFAVSTPLGATRLYPDMEDEIHLTTYGLSFGLSLGPLDEDDTGDCNSSVGLALFHTGIDYGEIVIEPAMGSAPSTFRARETALNFSAGFGFCLKGPTRLGIGVTVKKFKKHIDVGSIPTIVDDEDSGTAFDFGLIAEFPLVGSDRDSLQSATSSNRYWEITPSAAFVKSNMGNGQNGKMRDSTESLPAQHRLGLSVHFALRTQTVSIGSIRLSYQIDEDPNLEKITQRAGLELGLYEAFYFRSGYGKIAPSSSKNLTTFGAGIHTRGLFRLLNGRLDETPEGFLRNANVAVDIAVLFNDSSAWDETVFLRIDFSL